jgi:DNA-binding NarL/FixJ family response regulator
VVFDPHPLWIDVVSQVLNGVGVDVVGRATGTEEALEIVVRERPDLLVAEIAVSGGALSGLELVRETQKRVESLRVLALSAAADPAQIDAAFEGGVLAYVVKTAEPEDLASAVRQSFDHSVFFAGGWGRSAINGTTASAVKSAEETDILTKRELEILRLVAEGHTNAQMARMLWVTEQTVKFHLSNIYRKLDVANRTEASRWAQRRGVLREQEDDDAVAEMA